MRCCLIKSALNLHEFPEQKYKHWIKPGSCFIDKVKGFYRGDFGFLFLFLHKSETGADLPV